MIQVYPCGTTVTTKIGNIQAMITAINIRFDAPNYELTFHIQGENKTMWAFQKEFDVPKNTKKQKIGYVK